MRLFVLAISILFLGFSVSTFAQNNQTELLKALLNLPAPAPFDKEETETEVENKSTLLKEYLNTDKVPPDDAPIELLMEFWSGHGDKKRSYYQKPTEVVADRIFEQIEKKPNLLVQYLDILPPKKEYTEFIKQYYDEKSAAIQRIEEDVFEEVTPKNIQEALELAEKSSRLFNTQYRENFDNSYVLSNIKRWLKYKSKYFSDELEKKASRIKDRDEYVRHQEEMIALAKVDWEKAEPIAERLIDDKNQPASSTLAKWAYYAHFLHEKDERTASKYRRMLQDVVENRKAADGVRDLALDALVYEGDFDGRDEWYISLLEDETLYKLGRYSGLQTLMNASPAEKWIPKMINLVGNKSPAIHNAAVKNLVTLLGSSDKQDKLILQSLLPWLSDPNWAKDSDRSRVRLISTFGKISIPESVPALILILQNEKPAETTNNTISNTNITVKSATDKMKDAVKSIDGLGEIRLAAVLALASYKDPSAVPVLQGLLEVTGKYERTAVFKVIIESGGYSLGQQLNYLELFARKVADRSPEDSYEGIVYETGEKALNVNESIGYVIARSKGPNDNLIRLVMNRIKILQKSDSKVAESLNSILQNWKSKFLDTERLNSISNNTANLETIIGALSNREELRKEYRNQLYTMRGSSGIAGGISACILEDENEILSVINSGDINTQISGLACARLLRLKIPVTNVSSLLNNSNPLLALAAERYLISEDSYEARTVILGRYPGEAKILGSRIAFVPNKKANAELPMLRKLFYSVNIERGFDNVQVPELDKTQEKLREEIKTNQELLGVYAFLKNSTSGHQILRIYKDKAVYSWYEDEARYRERIVKKDELKIIFDYVADKEVEDLNPIIENCHHGSCPYSEFIMFGQNGGRRIFISSGEYYELPLYGLKMMFNSLQLGESKLHYWLQDKVEGLEVIFDDKNVQAKSLWKDGDDFRILAYDSKKQTEIYEEIDTQAHKARQALNYDDFDDTTQFYSRYSEISKESARQKAERKYDGYSWRSVVENKLGEKTSRPAEDYSINKNGEFQDNGELEDPESIWKVRNPKFEVRSGNYKKDGIWKVFRDGTTTQVAKENYTNEVVASPDGKWAIATLRPDTYYSNKPYRINLQTGKRFKLKLPKAILASPIGYIKAHEKFLIFTGGYENLKNFSEYMVRELKQGFTEKELKNSTPKYYLLDPNTGSFKLVKGEFKPLKQITFRNLQKTSNANEFWAAIPNKKIKETKIGRYNTKTFKFTEVMKVPEIRLDSMDIWLDEKDAKLYFIYEGDLLSIPFKPSKK